MGCSKKRQLFAIVDYGNLLVECGVSEELTRRLSKSDVDLIPMPKGDYKFIISDSSIEGKGVFASSEIKKGKRIGCATVDDKRTTLGRYLNHSPLPNSKFTLSASGDIFLVSIIDIDVGDEITTDYRDNLKMSLEHRCNFRYKNNNEKE